MILTGMSIENFKGIGRSVHLDLRQITLLFGPNSAGKSTIVHALHYACEIFERGNLDPGLTLNGGSSLDLGGFRNLIHNHDLSQTMSIQLHLDLDGDDLPTYVIKDDEMNESMIGPDEWEDSEFKDILEKIDTVCVEVKITWSDLLGRPILDCYSVGINGEEFAVIETSEDGKQAFSKLNVIHSIFLNKNANDEQKYLLRDLKINQDLLDQDVEKIGPMFQLFIRIFEIDGDETAGQSRYLGVACQAGSALPIWEKGLIFNRAQFADDAHILDQMTFAAITSSLIVGPGEMARDVLRKFKYIGPIREIPKRNFQPSKTYDESRWSNGLAAWDLLYKSDETFIAELNKWISREDKINTGYRVELKKTYELDINSPFAISLQSGDFIEEDFAPNELNRFPVKTQLVLKEELSRIEVHPQDIGVGISQVLPIIVASLASREGIIAMEQPELHIHPALQVALGDLFITRANESDACFLIETHSEHLILRLLRRIRETTENELEPGIDGFFPDQLAVNFIENEGDGATITSISVNEDGDFENQWPKGFFKERARELF